MLMFAVACSSVEGNGVELDTIRQGLTAADLEAYFTRSFASTLTNRCVENVRSEFENLPQQPSGKIRYRSRGGEALPPFGATLAEFGGWDSHIQGVSRLSLPSQISLWAAVSRSRPGNAGGAGVFLIHLQDVDGADGTRWVLPGDSYTGSPPANRATESYYPIADTDHPSGLQAVGKFLVVGAHGLEGEVPFVDFYVRQSSVVVYDHLQRFVLDGSLGEPTPPSRFVTAAAMTRLRSGRYLLFALGKDEYQEGWFYVSDQTSLTATTTWTFLDHVAVPWVYQNITLVTECASREIYLIGTNNPSFTGQADSGTEYADLLHFEYDEATGDVEIPLIDIREFAAGGGGYCTFRAAASPFVDKDGRLILYCHAHKANTNVLGQPDSKLKLVEYAAP